MSLLAEQPLLFLTLMIGVGVAAGRVGIRGIRLGPAAVLFATMIVTAWASALDVAIEIPQIVGDLGLVLFAFTTGLMAGPGFFAALRHAWQLVLGVTALICVAALVTQLVGGGFGLSGDAIAGTFAGAVTNTPALAAAGGSAEATVGYATAYVFGVLIMLAVIAVAFRHGNADPDTPTDVIDVTVRVECPDVTVDELRSRHGDRVTFSRVARQPAAPPGHVRDDDTLHTGDLVTVVGPADDVEELAAEIGTRADRDLTADRSTLDFRRITISHPRLAGLRVRDLELDRFDGHVTRVRRGDVDMVATSDTVVTLGDRVRVVAPPGQLAPIARALGDSSRGLTDLNGAALGFGAAAGLALGIVEIPVPGLGTLSIGAAAGTLIAGLILGRVGRVGRVVTTMPLTAAQVVSEIGLLLFLAYAGNRAGSVILDALTGGTIVDMIVTAIVTAAVLAFGMYVLSRWVLRVGRIRLAGVLAGTQTNPAHLAFANARSGQDPRIALGYALVYPAAMVAKILAAQVLVIL